MISQNILIGNNKHKLNKNMYSIPFSGSQEETYFGLSQKEKKDLLIMVVMQKKRYI